MCVYCENYAKKPYELKLGDIFIISPATWTKYGDGFSHSLPMNYCPACGKKTKYGKEPSLKKIKVDIPTYCSDYVMGKGDWVFVEQDEYYIWLYDETRTYYALFDYENVLPPDEMFGDELERSVGYVSGA